MRKLAIAMALASTAMAAPAVARDQSWYAGIEGGAMIVEDTEFDFNYDYDGTEIDNALSVDHNVGFDLDLIAGYDFGGFRAEAELGYKHAGIDDIQASALLTDQDIDADGSVRVFSPTSSMTSTPAPPISARIRKRTRRSHGRPSPAFVTRSATTSTSASSIVSST